MTTPPPEAFVETSDVMADPFAASSQDARSDRRERPALLALSPRELAALLGGPGRAGAVTRILRRGLDPFSAGLLAPSAERRLRDLCRETPARITTVDASTDGTLKALISFERDRSVELVLIPSRDRTTLCVSSQVGCARGCRFCWTATMGLLANLDADQIVAQVVAAFALARAHALPPVKNLVLMGMGEPLDNLTAVRSALTAITADGGLGLGRRHVTVSTVAPSPQAVRRAAGLPAHLAWSLHAADDELRRQLVPTTRHPVAALRDAFQDVLAPEGAPLFVEVTLIEGVNDRPEDAEAIVDLFRDFPVEVRINLLPMNPIGSAWGPSPPLSVAAFRDRLVALGLFCTIRRARGSDRSAACGQLKRSVGSGPDLDG